MTERRCLPRGGEISGTAKIAKNSMSEDLNALTVEAEKSKLLSSAEVAVAKSIQRNSIVLSLATNAEIKNSSCIIRKYYTEGVLIFPNVMWLKMVSNARIVEKKCPSV